ncbi:MAG: DUF6941 family protein [Acidiferrobacterales bacterium]
MMPRHVESLFCDDIRHEVGGKLSYIGVYSGVLLVPAFPAMLPKLCLSVKIVTPADDPLRSLTLRVLKDDAVLHQIVVSDQQLAAASSSIEDLTEEQRKERSAVTQLQLVFSPIQFEAPCVLKVRVQTESGELRGGGLRVDQAQLPADEASASARAGSPL